MPSRLFGGCPCVNKYFIGQIRQGDWRRDLDLYSRRRVIEPATISELKSWVRTLPDAHKDNLLSSVVERAQTVSRYEVL